MFQLFLWVERSLSLIEYKIKFVLNLRGGNFFWDMFWSFLRIIEKIICDVVLVQFNYLFYQNMNILKDYLELKVGL